ncbi:venom serine carboxypeptidase-like isoform X2 [Epargyreus clarus]
MKQAPLIIWLQGGPGVSSLFGLFNEVGPFYVVDNQTLKENKYTWGKKHSLLFIDNPVGAGFSFTDREGYTKTQDTIGQNLYSALQQFLTIFPELRTVPIFIGGESYAGKHIPSLAIQIKWHKGQDEPINLQGLMIGNGFIDPITLQRYSDFLREVGLVDDKTAKLIKTLEENVTQTIKDKKMLEAFDEYANMLQTFSMAAHLSNIYNFLKDDVSTWEKYSEFVERPAVRRALHVGNTTLSPPGPVYYHLLSDLMNSAKPWLEELLDHYRVLVYSGHLDCIIPYHASVNTYKSLKFSGAVEYMNAERFPWHHDGTHAGYVKTGGLLTEVMVRGAGHAVPADQPAPALGLISAFIQNIPINNTRTPV